MRNLQRNISTLPEYYIYTCSELVTSNTNNPSSNYILLLSSGYLTNVYCDLTRTFGSNSTGWMRVAELDVNKCPYGLNTTNFNSESICVVSEDSAGCTDIIYSVFNVNYTQVTG